MTSDPPWPLWRGFTRNTMVRYRGVANPRGELISEADRSPDCSLQLDCMKSESLVIMDQHAAVNTFPGLVTPPVTPWE